MMRENAGLRSAVTVVATFARTLSITSPTRKRGIDPTPRLRVGLVFSSAQIAIHRTTDVGNVAWYFAVVVSILFNATALFHVQSAAGQEQPNR